MPTPPPNPPGACPTSEDLRTAVARFTERETRRAVTRAPYRQTDREALQVAAQVGLKVLDVVTRLEARLAGGGVPLAPEAPPARRPPAQVRPTKKKAAPAPAAKAARAGRGRYAIRWADESSAVRTPLPAATDDAQAVSFARRVRQSVGGSVSLHLYRDARCLGSFDAAGWHPAGAKAAR